MPKGTKAKSKPKVGAIASTAVVLCDKDHALSGLFVVFKLKPKDGSSKQEKLARVLEGSKNPGAAPEPPDEPDAPGDHPTAAQKKKYAAATKKFRADEKKYAEAKKKYDAARELFDDLPPDPSDRFVLGIVDQQGYLQPVHENYNPWYDIATRRDPDTYKLSKGETYQVCALRHPSVEMARALVRFFNKAKVDSKWGFADWKEPLRDVTLDVVKVDGKDQVVMRLSEKASDYFPPGPSQYAHWTLYRSMPHAECEGVGDAVRQLQTDIGALRFPGGPTNAPFRPPAKSPKDLRQEEWPCKFPPDKKPKKIPLDVFDGTLQAAVGRMQEQAQAKEAVRLDKKAPDTDWGHVFFETVDHVADPGAEKEGDDKTKPSVYWPALPSTTAIGVVDDDTADLIFLWKSKRLRKLPEILCPASTGRVWMLERGALALDAWSLLVKALGCSYGVVPGSTLRSVGVGAWPGAVMNSVHKTGLAIDMRGGATRHSTNEWPIRFEAFWRKDEAGAKKGLAKANADVEQTRANDEQKKELEKKRDAETDPDKKKNLQASIDKLGDTAAAHAQAVQHVKDVKADDAEGRHFWEQRWRLYGHSTFDVFHKTEGDAAIAKLKAAVAEYAGVDPVTHKADSAKPGKLFTTIKENYFAGAPDSLVDPWLNARLAPYVANAIKLLDTSAEQLRGAYFRKRVVQWNPNFYEGDGGSNGQIYPPDKGDGDFPARADAKAWLNISAVGYGCQIERIGPHSDAIRDSLWMHDTWLEGPKHPKPEPKPWPMSAYFTVLHEEGDIVEMLTDMTAGSDADQLKARKIPVETGKRTITFEPSDVDGDFVKAWRDEALKFDGRLRPGSKLSPPDVGGAQLKLVLSVGGQRDSIEKVASALEGKALAAKSFVVTSAGDVVKIDTPAMTAVKGAALAAEIRKALEHFDDLATKNLEARKKREADATTKGPAPKDKKPAKKPEKTRAQILAEKKAADEQVKQDLLDWTLFVQPIFTKSTDLKNLAFLPDHAIVLPPGAADAHLEWWHFQYRSQASAKVKPANWGALLEECGYSLAVMGTPDTGYPGGDGGDPAANGRQALASVHVGLGYNPTKDFTSHGFDFNAGSVENRDAFVPEDC